MAEYGDEFAATIRERVTADIRRTLDEHGHWYTDEDVRHGEDIEPLNDLLDALVADAMHPVEQLISTLRKRAAEDVASDAERRHAEIAAGL